MRIRAARDWKLLLAVVAALAAGDLLFQLDQLPGGDVQNRKAYESTLLRNNLLVTPGVSAVARVVSTPQGLRGDLLSWRSFNVVGKPKNPVPAVVLGIVPDHQAASLCSFSHRS